MNTALSIVYIVISVLIIILVLAQRSNDNGFTTLSGATVNDGREIGKTFEKKLQVATTWLVVVYVLLSIAFNFRPNVAKQEETKFSDNSNVYQAADGSDATLDNVDATNEEAVEGQNN